MTTGEKIAVGLGVSVLAFSLYAEYQRKNNNPKIFYKKKLIGNYNGFALFPFGIFIKESEKNNEALLEHEMVHWQQFQREGFFPFLYNYYQEHKKNGYDGNKYEIEARTVEGAICTNNYTECVRKGLAKTVYNPNFRK